MIDVEDIKEWRGGGAMCPCGGPISKGALTGGRERWNCRACGRYEVMLPKDQDKDDLTA